jgi:regulatory protein
MTPIEKGTQVATGRSGQRRRAPDREPGDLPAGAAGRSAARPASGAGMRDGGLPGVGRAAGAGGKAGRWPGEAAPDPHTAAREFCLRLLTIAPRTRAQLAAALRRRRVPEHVAEEVLCRFTETGLIDDAAFASAWVESRHYSRGLSRRVLAAELRHRGVGEDEVREAIDELDPGHEAATARRLVDAKLAATRGQPPQVRTRRLVGTLARKGYPAAMVFRVVREALEQEGIDADETGLDDAAGAALEAADTWPDETAPD